MELTITKPRMATRLKFPAKNSLYLYSIIPICWIMALLDRVFMQNKIMESLPYAPEELSIYTFFFIMPHIIASFFPFLDKEYFGFYKKRLLLPAIIAAVSTSLLPSIISIEALIAIFLVWTIVHCVTQQIGIATMLARYKDRNLLLWKYSTVAVGIIINLDIVMFLGDRFLLSKFLII